MADKTLSMKELQDVLTSFIDVMEKAEGVRLTTDKKPAGKVPAATMTEALTAMKELRKIAGEVCQQPVLAVMFKKSPPTAE